jgi:hypothetical protein
MIGRYFELNFLCTLFPRNLLWEKHSRIVSTNWPKKKRLTQRATNKVEILPFLWWECCSKLHNDKTYLLFLILKVGAAV